MRVRHDKQKFSVAALLLCLVAGFAVSPPEYLHTKTPQRGRISRAAALDDHDPDHSLDAPSLSGDLAGPSMQDMPFGISVLPEGYFFSRPEGPPGPLPVAAAVQAFNFSLPIRSGRAPPAV
jgi:hypothetical protein